MTPRHKIIGCISFTSGLIFALAFAAGLPGAGRAAEKDKGAPNMIEMRHITTQAQAEAMKPGDAMSMTCTACKSVIVQKVTTDKAHVKMMTVGETLMCHMCDGTVSVVATGKGSGKDAEVKHVCSKCGDDAMFCAATKPGSNSMRSIRGMRAKKS